MKKFTIFAATLLLILSCSQQPHTKKIIQEDRAAKRMLQGIWINEDGEDVAFRVKGDTIFYPDTTSLPVYFQIIDDTLVLHGAKEAKYHIQKQAEHLFVFENQSGEHITLTKSEDASDIYYFGSRKTIALNQRQLIKRDSVIKAGELQYHYYVQVNPTTYKVVKTAYNDEGVGVDNVYYDNIVHLSIYQGARRIYSSNFAKGDFTDLVPKEYLSQSILSDITFYKSTADSMIFIASLAIPDASTSFQIKVIIYNNGKRKMQVFD